MNINKGIVHKLSRIGIVAVVNLAALAGPPSQAQTYTADDIVKHFGADTRNLAVSRGICVGTEAECNLAGQVVKQPDVFDLVIKFKYNSDVLQPGAKLNLDEFAKALNTPQLSANRFIVEGHTDASGTPIYNLDLSERRARAVVRYLIERGVETSKLLPRGYGQTKPMVTDRFSGDNRRVETRLKAD